MTEPGDPVLAPEVEGHVRTKALEDAAARLELHARGLDEEADRMVLHPKVADELRIRARLWRAAAAMVRETA